MSNKKSKIKANTTPVKAKDEDIEEVSADDGLPFHIYAIKMLQKNTMAAAVTAAVIFTLLLGWLYSNTFAPMRFSGPDFSTSTVQKGASMTISNDPSVNGVFSYGPYINLKKGSYKINVDYTSDVDIDFQISSSYGVNDLKTVTLPANNTEFEFDVNIPSDINDKSLEMRTFYHGKGTFTLNRVTVTAGSTATAGIPYMIAFVLACAACIFVLRRQGLKALFLTVWLGVFALLLYNALTVSIIGAFLFAGIACALIAAVGSNLDKAVKDLSPAEIIGEAAAALLCGYLVASAYAIYKNPEKITTIDFVKNVNRPLAMLITAAIFNILLVLRSFIRHPMFLRAAAEISVMSLAIAMLRNADRSIYFTMGVIAVSALFTYILCKDMEFEKIKLKKLPALAIVTFAFLVFAIFFSEQTIARYRSFNSSVFDFGIFAQMYEGILRTGLPLTTMERNELLSHFYIHFSPIYYTLVPIYFIFRTPETLLVCQAALVGAGVFPIFFLCGLKNKNYFYAVLISLCYLCLPCIISPVYYDFHENAFLPVMLLSTLYFLEAGKYKQMYIFAALSLLIKEDTAIYVLSIALYAIFAKKQYKYGGILFLGAGVYFGLVMAGIAHFEKGLMDSHYGMYYLPGEKGTAVMFKNMFIDPGLVVHTCFNGDTAEFILYTAGILLFLPFISKKISRLWLAVPYLLVNLVTNYGYQHNIGYQYVFGTGALLMFMFILNFYEIKESGTRSVIVLVTLLACICGTYTYKGNLAYYYNIYKDNAESCSDDHKLLQRIPKDVSITCETFLAPHLYNYKEVYQYKYDKEYTDYYVFQSYVENYAQFTAELERLGYEKIADSGKVIIYKSKDAPPLN
ncbi:MAG: DUF2079 domain-containing protein [Firmicutes bacterium]|nr:DUF2079 domain-containing protein [Bacillota bacterium]